MVQVKKIPPLCCPLCNSANVVRLFNKRKGRAFIATHKIVCYDCKQKVDLNSGESIHISIQEFEQKYLDKAQEQRLRIEERDSK